MANTLESNETTRPSTPWKPALRTRRTRVVSAIVWLAGAGAIVWAHALGQDPIHLVAAALYLLVGAPLAMIDLQVRRLPDQIVFSSMAGAGIFVVAWAAGSEDWSVLLGGLLGGLATFAAMWIGVFLFSLMGFGDVKWMTVGGILVGAAGGWPLLLEMLMLIGVSGLVVIVLALLGIGVEKMRGLPESEGSRLYKAHAAYGPAIVIGTFVVLLLAPEMWGTLGY